MNILLIQLKRIGDVILTTPAIAAVRETFPDAKLTLVISRDCAALQPALADANRVLIMPRGLGGIATMLTVARGKFDYCIDFTRNDRSAFLVFLSRAQKRIVSFRIKVRSKFRTKFYNEFVEHRMRDMHTIDYHLALLEPLGISNATTVIRLQLPEDAREKAEELRRSCNISSEFIVIHPGSARLEKFWEPARWAEVINHARKRFDVILTGGSSRLERGELRKIEAKLERNPERALPEDGTPGSDGATGGVVDLSGRTDLLTLTALLAQARLLVTVDSAPMHLAAATRTPQVILFGPTNPFHWRPRESPALILQGISTQPVTEFVSKQPRLPMKQISTQAVIDAMETLLSASTTPPPL
jgi:heptosyltransferase III